MRGISIEQLKSFTDEASYHGVLSAEEAHSVLKELSETCHLIRYDKEQQNYILSVMTRDKLSNLVIEITPGPPCQYEIGGTGKKFELISKMLDYFTTHPINQEVSTIGRVAPKEQKQLYPTLFQRLCFLVNPRLFRSREPHESEVSGCSACMYS